MVELRGVTFTYAGGDRPAIRDVDLRVERGEFVLLTGPSGCGKSTLCRLLNGLIPHFYPGELEGEVRVAGHDVRGTPTHVLARHVGMVFQNPENQLFLSTVERELAFGLENLGYPREVMERRVREALEAFGLVDLKDRGPHELSGGQQQKVAIASVMVMEPEVLVMDEPTANLDPLSAEEVIDLVNKLRLERGVTVILVEHRLEIALRYATRMVIMDEGAVVADGDPREVIVSEAAKIVGIPRVVEAYSRLGEEGVRLPSVPLSPEELAGLVGEVVSHGRRHSG